MTVKTFVLTGGPESGKSTIFRHIQALFPTEVLVYPEVASVMLGHLWPKPDPTAPYHGTWVHSIQHGIFATQSSLEMLAHEVVACEGQVLIGHDRGVLDNAAYLGISGKAFARMMHESWTDFIERYDLVIHLDTLARLHPEHYGSATNAARYETAQEAVEVDELTWRAYEGHPNHVRIPATDDFEEKAAQVLDHLATLCPTLMASRS